MTTSHKFNDLLVYPPPSRKEIQKYVPNAKWQKLRASLHGMSVKHRLEKLRAYLRAEENSRSAQVVVHNYINALKRGGML